MAYGSIAKVFEGLIFLQTVCPHYEVLMVGVSSAVHQGVRIRPRVSTVPHGLVAAGFLVVLPGVCALFEAKCGFTWQAQEIGWFWRIKM